MEWFKGMTISNVMDSIEDNYPYAAVHIDDKVVTLPKFDKFIVKDRSEIYLIPLIAGG